MWLNLRQLNAVSAEVLLFISIRFIALIQFICKVSACGLHLHVFS